MIVADTLRKKQEDHQDDQKDRSDHGQLHVVHGFPNRLGAVKKHLQLDGLRNLRAQTRENILDGIDDFDDVGARLPLYSEDDGPFIVEPAADSGVLYTIDRRADVLNAHRRAVAIGDDHRPISFRIGQLRV